MGITICPKNYCNSSSREKYLPQSFKTRSNILEAKKFTPLFGTVNYLDSIHEEPALPDMTNKLLLPSTQIRHVNPGAKKTSFVGSNVKNMPSTANSKKLFIHKQINKKNAAINENKSSSSNMIMMANKSSTMSNSSKLPEKLSVTTNKPSLDLQISSERKLKQSTPKIVSSPQLSELKNMHDMLQKSSYIPKERYISRKPTLEAIKDAIEKEKNKKFVDKNEGTSSIMFSVPTSDVSTNTIKSNKKKKIVKKNSPQNKKNNNNKAIASTSNAKNKPAKSKTLNKTANKVGKSQSGSSSKSGGSGAKKSVKSDGKKVKLTSGISVGVQYSVEP